MKKIQTIEIRPNSRYILVIKLSGDVSREQAYEIGDDANEYLQPALNRWYQSNEKFTVLVVSDEVFIEVKKIDDE